MASFDCVVCGHGDSLFHLSLRTPPRLFRSLRCRSDRTKFHNTLMNIHGSALAVQRRSWVASATGQEQAVERPGQRDGVESKTRRRRKRYRFSKPEMDSMEMLEWKKVCQQVASFASTPPAAQKAFLGKIEVGETLEESLNLVEQTREAMNVDLNFSGIYDVRRAMDAASRGILLHPLVIGAFATTLESIRNLIDELDGKEDAKSLQKIFEKHREVDQNLISSIREKIHVVEGRILDSASETLRDVRKEKRENFEELTKQADVWARKLHASGASERIQVVIRRDRRCIPVKAGRNGELPDGSVSLGTSGSGSTMYMEPEPLIPLNNLDIQLSEMEKEEEDIILKSLTKLIDKNAGKIRRLLSAVTKLDLACARAKHAIWLQGVQPHLISHSYSSDNGSDSNCIEGRDVMHPILLQPFLPPLPSPNLPQNVSSMQTMFTQDDSVASNSLEGINLIPELWHRDENGSRKQDKKRDGGMIEAESIILEAGIQPISLVIPSGKTAVIVTGPNTGGKTASLKTFGLISLMAKAGLFIPKSGDKKSNLTLMWFDKILVDVGDAQSLQQNLSTFSGHVKRIKHILKESTEKSLVLLDEIGSGTDPTEGAALAVAILDKLAHGGAAMTYSTTHHAELKELASKDSKFIDANVEFNAKTLLPTYKLIWGSSGESHALAVAQGLGFDPSVIQHARTIASDLVQKSETQFMQLEALKDSLPEQISSVRSKVLSAQETRNKQHYVLQELEDELRTLQAELNSVDSTHTEDDYEDEIQSILKKAKSGEVSVAQADQSLRNIAQSARSSAASSLAQVFDDADASTTSNEIWIPNVGDSVAVLSMGGRVATVESVNKSKGKVTLRAGMLTIGDVDISDIRKQDQITSKVVKKAKIQVETPAAPTTSQQAPAIQTSRNTVDCRGESADDAVKLVQDAIGIASPGAVLFVIHGVGKTGRVRAAVLEYLRKAKRVRKTEQQEGSNGGCAIVYLM